MRSAQRRVPLLAVAGLVLAFLFAPAGLIVSVVALARLRPTGGLAFVVVFVGLVVGAVGSMLLLWWWATQGQFLVAPPRYANY